MTNQELLQEQIKQFDKLRAQFIFTTGDLFGYTQASILWIPFIIFHFIVKGSLWMTLLFLGLWIGMIVVYFRTRKTKKKIENGDYDV